MAVDRTLPTSSSGTTTGNAYMDAVSEEVLALWDRSHNRLTAVGGTANVITATLTPALTGGGLISGMEFTFVPIGDNAAGGITMSINGASAVSLCDRDGNTSFAAGAVKTGRLTKLQYNGDTGRLTTTQDVSQALTAATVAQMKSATATNVAVTPGVQQFHPGHPKCVAHVTTGGTPTVDFGIGISSLTRAGTGQYQLFFSTGFTSNSAIIPLALTQTNNTDLNPPNAGSIYLPLLTSLSTASAKWRIWNVTAAAIQDVGPLFVAIWGDQ